MNFNFKEYLDYNLKDWQSLSAEERWFAFSVFHKEISPRKKLPKRWGGGIKASTSFARFADLIGAYKQKLMENGDQKLMENGDQKLMENGTQKLINDSIKDEGSVEGDDVEESEEKDQSPGKVKSFRGGVPYVSGSNPTVGRFRSQIVSGSPKSHVVTMFIEERRNQMINLSMDVLYKDLSPLLLDRAAFNLTIIMINEYVCEDEPELAGEWGELLCTLLFVDANRCRVASACGAEVADEFANEFLLRGYKVGNLKEEVIDLANKFILSRSKTRSSKTKQPSKKPKEHKDAPPSTKTDSRVCYTCDEKGHIAPNCPNKKDKK